MEVGRSQIRLLFDDDFEKRFRASQLVVVEQNLRVLQHLVGNHFRVGVGQSSGRWDQPIDIVDHELRKIRCADSVEIVRLEAYEVFRRIRRARKVLKLHCDRRRGLRSFGEVGIDFGGLPELLEGRGHVVHLEGGNALVKDRDGRPPRLADLRNRLGGFRFRCIGRRRLGRLSRGLTDRRQGHRQRRHVVRVGADLRRRDAVTLHFDLQVVDEVIVGDPYPKSPLLLRVCRARNLASFGNH